MKEEVAKDNQEPDEHQLGNNDDLGLVGDGNEEDAASAKQAPESAKTDAGQEEKIVIEKSLVILEVKPSDDTIDLDALGERILREIQKDGLSWKTEFKKEPVAHGIFKLIIGAAVEDAKVSVDNDIVGKIEEMDDMVQSVDVKSFDKL